MALDRVELHRKLAEGKWKTYAEGPDTRHISYPDEWVYSPDAVIMCPLFNDGEPQHFSEMLTDEMIPLLAGLADGDVLTPEMRMWWKHMPDFRIVSAFDYEAADWGFAVRDTYAGTLPDGRVLELHEWDYLWTNAEGHITRWDWFVDSREWKPFLELIGLEPAGLTYQAYMTNYLRVGGTA